MAWYEHKYTGLNSMDEVISSLREFLTDLTKVNIYIKES